MLPVPGLAEHGLGFKTLADAIALRNRALLNLEIAESLPDDEERRAYLTFVFVGAGYAGLEGIAELQDYVADVIERYPRCRMIGTRWILVEARERVMPEIPASLAEFATRELRGRGIEIRTSTMLDAVDDDSVTLSTGERVPTAAALLDGRREAGAGRREARAAARRRAGASRSTTRCACAGSDERLGDRRRRRGARPGQRRRSPSPPTCQHAIRQGRRVADNVAAALGGHRPKPFRYRTLGVFVDMGQHKAVATMLGVRLRGFPAWFAARTYHLAMMPGLARQVRLAVDWTVGLFFGRASAELGQLGHPAVARGPSGRSARSGERPLVPRGTRRATCAPPSSWPRPRWTPRARSAACCRASISAPRTTWPTAGSASAAARVHRRPGRRLAT